MFEYIEPMVEPNVLVIQHQQLEQTSSRWVENLVCTFASLCMDVLLYHVSHLLQMIRQKRNWGRGLGYNPKVV